MYSFLKRAALRMKILKRLLKYLIPGLVASLLVANAVLAYTYSTQLQVVESDGTAHVKLAMIADMDNDYLATHGFIDADGLDTRVELGGVAIPHMVADDKTLFVNTIGANTTNNFYYTCGNTPLSNFDIITGNDGYITIPDDDTLEGGADFQIDLSGYINTSASHVDENLLYKSGALRIYVDSAGSITALMGEITGESITMMTPSVDCAPATGNWNDVDANTYGVPAEATGVVLHYVNPDAAAYQWGFRKNGSTDARNGDMWNATHNWAMVGIDDDGIFEIYVEDPDTAVYITGYTNSNVTFLTNGENISLGSTGAWTDIDCSAIAPDAKAVIVETVNAGGGSYSSGLRPNGSASEVTYGLYREVGYHSIQIIGCDGSQVIEGKIDNVAMDCYLIGYITDGVTMFTNPVDKSLGGAGSWTDIDCSANAPANATGLIFSATHVFANYGLRKNSSAEDIYRDAWDSGAPVPIIECDGSQIVEGKISDTSMDFWLWGYFGLPNGDTVTAACASGNHDIRVVYDGADLELFIDNMTVAADTLPLVSTLPANDIDWIFMSNAIPYASVLTIDVSSIEKLRYEPVDIIVGTTLIDETGSNDGEITWGDNPGPSGIAITIGSMMSAGAPTPSAGGGQLPTQDVVPPIEQPTGFLTTPISTNTTHVLYPFMHTLSDLSGIPIGLTWLLALALPVTVCVLIATLKYLHNQLLVLAFVGVTMLIFWQMGIYPFWVPMIYGFAAGAIVIYERKAAL